MHTAMNFIFLKLYFISSFSALTMGLDVSFTLTTGITLIFSAQKYRRLQRKHDINERQNYGKHIEII